MIFQRLKERNSSQYRWSHRGFIPMTVTLSCSSVSYYLLRVDLSKFPVQDKWWQAYICSAAVAKKPDGVRPHTRGPD